MRFLDTNILLRYLTRDDEQKGRQALELLARVERGEEKVVTFPMVIFETVFTLQKRYQVPRERIRDSLGDIISMRGLELPNKRLYERALDLYASKNISFADAFHASYMRSQGVTEIYSWDTD
ncbi:MAG: PIN domain-containing protein, partial [Dehalococcoidia bacterium]|nr:PIN domain-containing protein [Dehalococcoidia bacterium]